MGGNKAARRAPGRGIAESVSEKSSHRSKMLPFDASLAQKQAKLYESCHRGNTA